MPYKASNKKRSVYLKPVFINSLTLMLSSSLMLLSVNRVSAEDIPSIYVSGTAISDVSTEEIKSADLAEALLKNLPSISIIRRSGIANDIILRGQNKDNINILIDDAKIYGACPNRMDPPTSHILTNNIESILVTEGPYDVENFGTLSGAVRIKTKKPKQAFQGEASVNLGQWNYRKFATTMSGGNETLKALLSISQETSDQYQDGNNHDFQQQLDNNNLSAMTNYKNNERDRKAYDKQTFMGKLFVDISESQSLKLSYTANRSNNVLYPSSMMDAVYDDSNMFSIDYQGKNLAQFSKQFDMKYYYSDVDHPMSNIFRNSSGPNGVNVRGNKLTTKIQGFKVKNTLDLEPTLELSLGVDMSVRNWNGAYYGSGMNSWVNNIKSINDVDTENKALFLTMNKKLNQLSITTGLRYDDTLIKPLSASQNNYQALSGFVQTNYQANQSHRFTAGIGKSTRVPDARELFFNSLGMTAQMPAMVIGTPNLKQTSNIEIDLGSEHDFDKLSLKSKVFYSWLNDYIYYNADKAMNRFENIDATIYGFDLSGLYALNDELFVNFGLAYQRGKKDQALAGQTDRDLANITPLKINLGLNYEYSLAGSMAINLVAADTWDKYDADNGEQRVSPYAVVNVKLSHQLNRSFNMTLGVDNVFDRTYAINNTYKDLTLLTDGSGQVMQMNEPGRYFYAQATYSF